MPARNRRGLSILELVVLLLIVLLLFALLLPATRSAKGAARRTQCLSNMRNVGLAAMNYSSQNGGMLPALDDGRHGWTVSLLRPLDQPAVARKIESPGWSDDKAPYLQVFTCPNDDDSFQQPGGLSYVANAGYGFFPVDSGTGAVTEKERHSLDQDWNGDGEISDEDRYIARATGVFWRRQEGVRSLTLTEIGNADGTANTLLLTENLHAGPWITDDARTLGFVIGRERLTFDRAAGPLAVTRADLGPFAINGAKGTDGPVPAPSSNHPNGGINVIWADGRGTSLSESIDPLIYVRILTPQGSLYGQQPIEDDQASF